MIKVLIADDQELIRQSLSYVLDAQKDIEIVGTAVDGKQAIELVRKQHPDVVLMDIRMPEVDGVECTKLIKSAYPNMKIIILTTFDDDEYVFNALRYGASGYLLKGVSVAELAEAVREVVRGGSIIMPGVASKALEMFARMAHDRHVFPLMTNRPKNCRTMNGKLFERSAAVCPTRRSLLRCVCPKARYAII